MLSLVADNPFRTLGVTSEATLKAINAAQAVLNSKASKPSGTIILYFAPSSKLGEPDAEKVTIKSWKL